MAKIYENVRNMSMDEIITFLAPIIDTDWVYDALCENGCEHSIELCAKGECCIYNGDIELALHDILNWSEEKYRKVSEEVMLKREKRNELFKCACADYECPNIRESDLHKYKELLCWIENISEDKAFDSKYSFSTDKELAETIECMLAKLSDTKRKAIKLAFGIGYEKKFTNSEIAKELNITSSRIAYIKKEVYRELKKPSVYQLLMSEPLLIETLKDFEFSTRTYNAVRRQIKNISELIDVVEHEPEKLTRIRNLGEKGVQEVLYKVKCYLALQNRDY